MSFTIPDGEVVGFLRPNGAGKTPTLKCLSGLLHPTSGTARVLSHEPFCRDPAFLSRIALVMGQRNSLFWTCRRSTPSRSTARSTACRTPATAPPSTSWSTYST